MATDHRLEQRAHLALALADEAQARRFEFGGAFGRAFGERARAQIDAERAQEVALIDRAVDGGAGGARAARHGGEIDMGGQVAFARLGQRVDLPMGAHGLQRIAKAGGGAAVVEEQRRAALFGQPRAEFEHEAVGDGADLDHRAFGAPRA